MTRLIVKVKGKGSLVCVALYCELLISNALKYDTWDHISIDVDRCQLEFIDVIAGCQSTQTSVLYAAVVMCDVSTGSPLVIGVEDTEDSKPKDGRR